MAKKKVIKSFDELEGAFTVEKTGDNPPALTVVYNRNKDEMKPKRSIWKWASAAVVLIVGIAIAGFCIFASE